MDVFEIHQHLIDDYDAFTTSLVQVRDERIGRHLREERGAHVRWPDPWLSLNPSFESGGALIDLVNTGLLHPATQQLFRIKTGPDDQGARPLTLYRHQREAVEAARTGDSYVVTTGTGSGKSLTYILPIVDAVLRDPAPGRIKAIVVYPMNALANSQYLELGKYLTWGLPSGNPPVTFDRYTGQEKEADRDRILQRAPDILLTNYVMLEYLLTRPRERKQLIGAARGLRFLVLDELHTYRGRQGADVALLVRRLRDASDSPSLQCVGTSATMATGNSSEHIERAVAKVAARLFGTSVDPRRVIGEHLRRVTPSAAPAAAMLRRSITAALADDGRDYAALADDPLASWIETTFGLRTETGSGRLVRQRPVRVPDAARQLAETTAEPQGRCADAIQAILQQGSRVVDPESGRPLFAFRLHQFLSKGDTVYVSLNTEDERFITSQKQVSVPEDRNRILLPLAFCRECGQEYLVVARNSGPSGTVRYAARLDQDACGGNAVNGYLYISANLPWPTNEHSAIQDGRLPDSWYDVDSDGSAYVLPTVRDYLPREVWLGPDGHEQDGRHGLRAAYLPTPFRFCLRCRVSYEQVRGRDFAKLGTFAAEGRSSAVSLISTSVVRALHDQHDLPDEAKKLLTFVDNRQDASLQAGHLNDFVQVTQLRGALYRAAFESSPAGLRHDDVAQAVLAALELPLDRFAQNPGVKFSQRDYVLAAMRRVLAYRIYSDLERGWRVTMPNLEQTGLLRFGYTDLTEIAHDEESWRDAYAALRDDTPEHREQIAQVALDEMRRSLAVEADVLTSDGFERTQQVSDQQLTGSWAIPPNEPPVLARTVYAIPGTRGGSRESVHFTGRGALGRYLRQPGQFPLWPGRLTTDDAQQVITSLLNVLEQLGLLITDESRGTARGYRLKSSALIWRAGDGKTGAPDPLRKTVDPEAGTRVNEFYRDLYALTAPALAGLVAREHTAQVRAEDRQDRERAFRSGALPLLYCSPTMELGVDIADLNAVGMRNVPPTPANYVQRSGRAGRSGQPALVTTYCSTGSAHDQYYFRRSELMVAGHVAPPRLDLCNEDLVRSHMHAIWLAETGAGLGTRMTDVIDVSDEDLSMPVRDHLARQLADPSAQRRAVGRGRAALAGLADELDGSSWWAQDTWLEDTLRAAPARFSAACDRWRQLYRAALADQREQNRRVLDHATAPEHRRQAQARRADAENQLRLLKNEDSEQEFSDFYSYRYFASEGFLPGYSFPRLPLAAYVPGERRRGTYIQRPRFIAVSEFGPGALIYHEGQRYQVKRVQVPSGAEPGEVATVEARVCGECGYWHDRQVGVDRCEECGALLGGVLAGLMHLQTVHTVRRRRISSDEEERRRTGFELKTSYRFSSHGTRPGRLHAEILGEGSAEPIVGLVYGDAATVRVVNSGRLGRKNRDDIGFWLDPVRGEWLTEGQAADRTPEDEGLASLDSVAGPVAKVIPYVEDTKNICVLRLAERVPQTTAISLRYALERGIETHFQLEDAELTSESLPDPDDRARMLFVESAEGGAGVLRRLHAEPDALAKAAQAAIEIIHFDVASGADKHRAPGAREDCGQGCYDCLLSYTNQRDHALIDRHAAADLLFQLATARTRGCGLDSASPEQHANALGEASDNELERSLVRFLRDGGYRLPDEAQPLVPDVRARPDFAYRLPAGDVAVFVDGPHHNDPHIAGRDTSAGERLFDLGWLVVRFGYDQDKWEETVRKHPGVFGTGRVGG
jgi:superfamily II DNA/RNA helicase